MIYRFYISSGMEFIFLFLFLTVVLLILFGTRKKYKGWMFVLSSTALFTFFWCLPKIITALSDNAFSFSIFLMRPYSFIFTILIALLFTHIFLEGPIPVKLFYILLFQNVIVEFKVVCSPLYDEARNMNPTLYMCLDILCEILLFVLLLLLSKLFRKYRIRTTPKTLPKFIFMIFYYPVSLLFIYLWLSYFQYDFKYFLPLLSLILISNIPIIYTFFFGLIRSTEDRQQLDIALTQANAQLEQYRYSIEVKNKIRKERHELQNNYFYIRALLEEKKYDKISEFIDRKIGVNIEELFEISSGNVLMDHILNIKIREAHKHSIKTYTEVIVPEHLPTIDDGFCSILLNVLDNAIEASLKEKDPDIHIKIKTSGNYLVFKVMNKTSIDVLKENPELKSTKEDAENHGIGIQIITETVAKKDGIINFEMEGGYFGVTIMLPVISQQSN